MEKESSNIYKSQRDNTISPWKYRVERVAIEIESITQFT